MNRIDDPFRILGIAPDADLDTVRRAWHAALREGRADGALNAAAGRLRDPAGLERERLGGFFGCLAPLPDGEVPPLVDEAGLVALIRELASVSDWELGDG